MAFLSGPGAPVRWSVARSFGHGQEQPLWRAALLSGAMAALLLWCALRGESDVDAKLGQVLALGEGVDTGVDTGVVVGVGK
ncbi:unnamed protein product [Lampetra fluviatilis]